mmetsp:Transcript_6593/g.15121  ORF Transcript_6593/g.15121 Transcript_6593/m.15121 type:complete len:362 (+) Transcript_6593:724-1809(+)
MAARALGHGHDAVVLGEGRVGHRGHERGAERRNAIGQQATLDRRGVLVGVNLERACLIGGTDVTNRLDRGNHERNKHRKDCRPVEPDWKGLDPEEGENGNVVDPAGDHVVELVARVRILVRRHSSDHVTEKESDDHVAVLHEGRAEDLDENEHDDHREAQADVLRRAVGKGHVAGRAVRAREGAHFARPKPNKVRDLAVRLPAHLGADGAAAPVLHASPRQGCTDEQNCDARDERREPRAQALGRDERQKIFEEGAHHRGAEHLAVRLSPVDPVGLHLTNCRFENRKEGEGSAHDGEDAGADEELAAKKPLHAWDLDLDHVHDGEEARHDKGGRDGVLMSLDVGKWKAIHRELGYDKWRGN